jgi:sialate O-acetylesterase
MKKLILSLAFGLILAPVLRAELKLPAIIDDHMVLQQKLADPIWGWDTPGTKITVSFAGQDYSTIAGTDGKWMVKLAPLPANATPQTLTVAGSTKREIRDVLIGEVWMCSGQSNMGFILADEWNGDLAAAAANLPNLRLIKVPNVGTQKLQDNFKGGWQPSTPASARWFSAVGFLFGRHLNQILNVPVGLIDNAWGGSAAEAWVPRPALENDPRFKSLMDRTAKREAELLPDQGKAEFEQAMAKWKVDCVQAGTTNPPWAPEHWLAGRIRAGNIFAGVLHPTLGFGIKGVIWYQGEGNAWQAYEYATLFPFMIEQWRKEWGQGDFPFYWVQLPNFGAIRPEPGDGDWAELRAAQTQTMKLPNTGQAVTIDLGEGDNIHPKNKYDVAARLVRWALVKDYGMKLPYRSPEFKSLTITSNKVLVTFDCFGSRLRPFGVMEARGFAVCGTNKVWHWATGKIVGANEVEVMSKDVAAPVAVRYAWADNPVCNLFSNDGLPVTPFRTDDFEMITKPKP